MAFNFIEKFTKYSLPIFENGVRLPEIIIPAEKKKEYGCKEDCTNSQYLRALTEQGCKARIKQKKISQPLKKCLEIIKSEFEVFEKTSTIDYLLLLVDILYRADEKNIIRGVGRGSAAGSLSLFCLGLTEINPLDYDLSFTRFLSEARAKSKLVDGIVHVDGKTMCDFDADIEYLRRDEVIKDVEERYKGKTCKISTVQYLTGKTALKDTLKSYLAFSEEESKHITDNIEVIFGKVKSIQSTVDGNKKFREWVEKSPKHKEAIDIAQKLEGLVRGYGVHASGMLISYYNMDKFMPREMSSSDEIVSGYDMDFALTVNVKIDLLGLKTLNYLGIIEKETGVNPKDINVNDQCIYDLLKNSERYYGLFQIEDGATKEAVKKIKPKNIKHLCAIIAISRPGAMKYIDDFAKFVNEGTRTLIYKPIDDILEETGNIVLYQEQISSILTQVYGMTKVRAEDARRAIGKKSRDDLKKLEPEINELGEKAGVPKEATKWFWDTCNASADYLFNKSHSASYCEITAQTAYLKAKYPQQFYLACLRMARHEQDQMDCVKRIQNELSEVGLTLLPPRIGVSQEDYSMNGTEGFLMGLTSIKGVSEKSLEKVKAFSAKDKTKFQILEAASEAKINIGLLSSFIYSGCLELNASEAENEDRAYAALEAQIYNLLTAKERTHIHRLAKEEKYGNSLIKILKDMVEVLKDEKGKPLIKDTRYDKLKRDYAPYKAMYMKNSKSHALCAYIMEQHFLGFAYSNTLKEVFSHYMMNLSSLSEIYRDVKTGAAITTNEKNGKSWTRSYKFVCFVEEAKKGIGKESKRPYIRFSVFDDAAKGYVMINGEEKINDLESLCGKIPEAGDIIIVDGSPSKDGSIIFTNNIILQPNPIRIKKGDLKMDLGDSAKN